ncbi:uncharacterized protein LOC124265056 isoform X2 [Haliotis rubra]|uniref:uncharacterized protein LOC124265056 isoform X1 n=1 Tax=Haliotis rubra TaxID=36100 RepID=UPI001EE5A2FB|nr:uncharacterized protein LOC124265056 isoform X1 [Haliotis rubra]XP_046555808.1 uncharacterized protein LOC124265056 isoform X2 [Haliotis rubra]
MGTEDDVFFIHLHQAQVDRKTKGMKPSAEYQFKKALSSMRNSGGGVLFVHVGKGIFRKDKDAFQSTVVPVLGAMLTEEEIMSDGFRWHRAVSEGEQVYKVDVLPSETFISADLKTKLLAWCVDKHVTASVEKLRQLLLSKRTVSTTEPTVQGLPHLDQADAVKIYVDRNDDKHVYQSLGAPYRSVSVWVNHIINSCSLPQYVTSISKRKQGGSVYVGVTGHNNNDDMDGVSLPWQGRKHELQSMLAEELQKEISVFKNRHSDIVLKPKDVFQIKIHDTGTNCGIVEVAVRSVDGCVFHDPLGPASFKIEKDSNAFVRLSFDKWMEVATG